MHVVVLAQRGGGGLVFEVEEEWGGIEKGDGGDTKGHRMILEDCRCTAVLAGMLYDSITTQQRGTRDDGWKQE